MFGSRVSRPTPTTLIEKSVNLRGGQQTGGKTPDTASLILSFPFVAKNNG